MRWLSPSLHGWQVGLFALGLHFGSHAAAAVSVSRYAVMRDAPAAQQDLLQQAKSVHFSSSINTVGDAVRGWLQGSGYRLVPLNTLQTSAKTLLSLPLPAVHRELSAMPLLSGLQVLIGQGFQVVVDPAHRYVSFFAKTPN